MTDTLIRMQVKNGLLLNLTSCVQDYDKLYISRLVMSDQVSCVMGGSFMDHVESNHNVS
jgi:hypothetical protein